MRRRAAAISASTPGRRLPVPAGRDGVARLAATLNEMLARLETAFEHERLPFSTSGASSPTPATSYARRSRYCRPSWRSRCAVPGRGASSKRPFARPPKRPSD
jgi:hypothetical protein